MASHAGALAAATTDPDNCYFGLWDGWGFRESARRWPTFGLPRGDQRPARSYFLFHGSLSEAAIWGGGAPANAGIWGLPEFSRGGAPAFVWPSTARGVSPPTSTHTGQRSAVPLH